MKWRIVPRTSGGAVSYLLLACEHGVNHGGAEPECLFPLWREPAVDNDGAKVWQWDGNTGCPTITPSIDCKGRCGRHFTMTCGKPA